MQLNLQKTSASRVSLKLRCGEEKESIFTIDLKKGELTFDRNNSDGWSNGISRSPLDIKDKETLDVHIFSDQSSVEIFTDNYKNNHANNIFASDNQNQNYIFAEDGEAYFDEIRCWGLERTMK